MAKVKIVQIAGASGGECADWLYLDDKGRVWFDNGKRVLDEEHARNVNNLDALPVYRWIPNWQQIPLPDEPEGAKK